MKYVSDEVCAYVSRVVAHSELYNPLVATSKKPALGQLNHRPTRKSRQAREEHHINRHGPRFLETSFVKHTACFYKVFE